MPATRRKPSNPSTRAQQTLAFGPNANKVTKPSLPPQPKKLPKTQSDSLSLSEAVAEIATPSPSPAPEDEQAQHQAQLSNPRTLAIRNQQAATTDVKSSDIEVTAAKVPETQVRKYWRAKEEERIAPRVHQKGLSVNEKILRHFDLSSQYGPCIGIPRVKRWKRAQGLGLHPPIEVLAVLLKEEAAKNGKAERAFMEGLLTSRLAVNE